MHKQNAIIIGAGAIGLTVAHHLLTHTEIRPIVLERENFIGGMSRTLNFGGNLLEIGRHGLFSEDAEILSLWRTLLPDDDLPERQRISEIFCRGKIFQCPVAPTLKTIGRFGLIGALSIGASLLKSKFARRDEITLADVLSNRFGQKFAEIFFGGYVTKIFGRAPEELGAAWNSRLPAELTAEEKFFYPRRGVGQLWQNLADKIKQLGGEVLTDSNVKSFRVDANKLVKSVTVESLAGTLNFPADIFLTSMPYDELADALDEKILPANLRDVAKSLPYRSLVTVGLLVDKLKISTPAQIVYVAEPTIKLARLNIFNALSPELVADKNSVWLGLDYFCGADDELWGMDEDSFVKFAAAELVTLGIIDAGSVKLGVRVKVPKIYPVFDDDDKLAELRGALNEIKNLKRLGHD